MDEPTGAGTLEAYRGVYQRAIALLREYGWSPDRAIDGDGRVCLLVAVTLGARGLVKDENEPGFALARHLDPDVRANSAYPVIVFNSTEGRTAEDVIALLETVSQ